MDAECQYKSLYVCNEFQTLIVIELLRLIDLTDDVRKNIPHILIVHQLDNVPFLIN